MNKNLIIGAAFVGAMFTNLVYATDQLTATIIGSGSPIYNKNRASASVLVSAGNTHILVDMGNGTQANLDELGVEVRDLSSLFLTHHHLDHNEEFVPVFIRSLLGRNDFTIVGPPNTIKFAETNLALYEEDISYRLGKTQRTIADRQQDFSVTEVSGGESFTVDDINVSTLEVPHTIHTIAYRFDYEGQSVVITGDLTYSDKLPNFAKNADVMIIDSGGMIMKDGRGKKRNANVSGNEGKANNRNGKVRAHLDLDDSSSMAQAAKVKTLVYTHFNSTVVDTEASLEKIREHYSGNVIFGEDLMVINTADNSVALNTLPYAIVDTGQKQFYGNDEVILLPENGSDFFGQDANYIINDPSYTDNHDGTITDNVTGLIWQKELGEKLTYQEAMDKAETLKLAGYDDWRVASIKELYSLIQFTGRVKGANAITPFIDTNYFEQPLGGANPGEREIDAQVWSSTEYVSKTMKNDDTVFGVNFVDGRIKGYPKYHPGSKASNKMYVRFVRGNSTYGKNSFVDNGNGTVSDNATGLMWQQSDSHEGLDWEDALEYAEDLKLGGYDDWRLPNAKELQSIVDYTRSPETSNSAAIASIFEASSIENEGGDKDYPYYWTSTTHLDGPVPEANAVYIAFGKALGEMHGSMMDVHGAGAQRSDPKTGEAMSRGPQGDMIRVNNYVRAVRGGTIEMATDVVIEPVREFTVVDKNSANKSEKRSPIPSRNNNFINRLDKNGDGKVSSSEFPRGAERFKQFDKNNDGYITADEAPTGPPKNDKAKK